TALIEGPTRIVSGGVWITRSTILIFGTVSCTNFTTHVVSITFTVSYCVVITGVGTSFDGRQIIIAINAAAITAMTMFFTSVITSLITILLPFDQKRIPAYA